MLNQEKAWKDLLLLCTEQHRVSSNREKHPMWMLLFSPLSLSALLSPSHTLSLSLSFTSARQPMNEPKSRRPFTSHTKRKRVSEHEMSKCAASLPLFTLNGSLLKDSHQLTGLQLLALILLVARSSSLFFFFPFVG